MFLQVFVNSFCENSLESLYSRRLKYLMETKRHLIEIKIIDANLELSQAMSDVKIHGDTNTNLREKLFT